MTLRRLGLYALAPALVSLPAWAATPASGTLTDANTILGYNSTFTQANATFDPPTCTAAANRYCDDFTLTVNLPAGYAASHPGAQIVIKTTWLDANDDFDLYLQNSSGAYLSTQANSGPSPEIIEFPLSSVAGGGNPPVSFNIRIVLFSKGTGPNSGRASTLVELDPGPVDPCVLPGVRVALDPVGDQGAPGTSQQDIRWLAAAELGTDTAMVTLTMKVAQLGGALPASAVWRMYFTAPNNTTYYVDMMTDASSALSFNFGTRGGSPAVDTRSGGADSGAYATDGTITFKIAKSRIGNPAAGQRLTAVFARTYLLVGAAGSGSLQTIDSDANAGGGKQYTLVGNEFCGTPPPQTPCVLPGITALSDPPGDQAVEGTAKQDIQYVAIAEPATDSSVLSLTLKVADLSGSLTASAIWRMYFMAPNGTNYFVSMVTDASANVSYTYGTRAGTTDTTVGGADSGTVAADGSIRIRLATAKIGSPAPGQTLTAISAVTYVRIGGPVGPGTIVATDDATNQTGSKQYTLVGNAFCGTPPPPTPCVLPGMPILADPSGDQAAPGTSKQDIQYVAGAELAVDASTLTLTMKVTDLSGTLTASGVWKIYFRTPVPPPAPDTMYWVAMETDSASAVSFTYGTSDGTFDTTLGAADGGSFTTDGAISIKIARSKIGNPVPGQKVTAVVAQTQVLVGAVLIGTDDDTNQAGTKEYTIVGNTFCGDPPPESPCELPGITTARDPSGDQGSPGTGKQDIQYLALAEPGADTDTVTFTMKVADLAGTLSPNGIWRIYFTAPDGTDYWVDMESDAASATSFSYGTTDGTLDSGVGAADGGLFLSDGSIRIKLANSKMGGVAAGQTLTSIFGRTYLLVGGAGSGVLQTTDDEANQTGVKQYTLVGNDTCANARPIIDSFTASTTSGPSPLDVTFTALAHDPDGVIATYTFDFGDGTPAVTQTEPSLSHTYDAIATYVATLKVADAAGAQSATAAITIEVLDSPPVAVLVPNVTSGESPLAVMFDASGSSDPDAGDSLTSYTFDFDDGTSPVTQPGATISHTYSSRGTYDATLTVTDSHGVASTPAMVQIVVTAGPPVAQLAISPPAPAKGTAVTLDASFSSADAVVDYTFDPGDGSGPVTVLPPETSTSHVYHLGGSYTVSLSVRDTQDVVDTTTATITVTNTAPVADLTATPDPAEGEPPLTVSFDASGSYDPDAALLPDEDFVESYEFDFGDGSPVETVSVPAVNHTYTAPGTYEARLTVYDHEGKKSSNQAAWPNIVVLDGPPVAVLGADQTSGYAPLSVVFDGAGSSDPDAGDSVVSYTFDFDDGSDPVTRVGATWVQHVFADPGEYVVTLVVRDESGVASTPATLTINVGPVNRAPIARASADKLSGNAPLAVTFNASASSDTDGDAIVEYTFDFGDGSALLTQAQPTATHTYATAGRYAGSVRVKDARGALSSNSDAVTITATVPLGDNTTVAPFNDSKGPFSGALSPWLLSVLMFGLARRRRR